MQDSANKLNIKSSITSFVKGNLTENGIKLFQSLGYVTERQAHLDKPTYTEFKDSYIDSNSKFNEEKALVEDWKYVDLLFQLSKEEVLKQTSLFDTKQVDKTVIETYLFFTIELKKDQYSRTELSLITREVNRLFPMPVMILFKLGGTLTLSVINRRLHKRDETKDILEKVTQIKDVNIENPHRAHIEILFDLSFEELKEKEKFTNFVELHNAWQKTLDTKELNKKFFNELANWYFWATQMVAFPDDAEKDKDIRNATGVIRLITRLMFVWFLKEKGLVSEELFDEKQLKKLIRYTDERKSTYYKAILQNLFFATLNTEMGSRKFRTASDKSQSSHYFIHNLFRYEKEFISAKETLEKYFAPIPFLNGGLFECLDKQVETKEKLKSIRIDGFSDRTDNVLKVPDELFFSEKEKEIDLNETFGTKNKHYKVRGLINILNRYKFTITENTPIEEEIALDPELLGKVFENLLANFNPETQTTARKQTGSFYTPREIVNYMVDESLVGYLRQQLDDEAETKLRDLLLYSEKETRFSVVEKEKLITAIDNIKIIDPACGSGAFPMGILHKLVHILHKLDPKNELWKQRQIEKANCLDDAPSREAAIETIEEAFENNELDYGRKLYLIENCIYGVDIQPIAVQISKLRFFISLIVEQKINQKKDNLGVRPLPNLETKFVAANTLIELEKENANLFTNPEIEKKKEQIRRIRHDYFEARTPKRKENCRSKDKQLRNELAELLVTNHDLQPATAKRVAAWNPYDQNASAAFFDMEWMFGLQDGFDVVIGNPPYGYLFKEKSVFDLMNVTYKTAEYKIDSYTVFTEKAGRILAKTGLVCFITPYTFLSGIYFSKFRTYLKENYLQTLIVLGKKVFQAAEVDTCIFIFKKAGNRNHVNIADFRDSESIEAIKDFKTFKVESGLLFTSYATGILVAKKESIKTYFKITNGKQSLKSFVLFYHGIQSRGDEGAITLKRNKYSYPLLKGRDFNKYKVEAEEKYFTFVPENIKSGGNLDFHLSDKKIIIRTTADRIVSTIDYNKYLVLNSVNIAVSNTSELSLEYVLGIINSRLIEFWYELTVQESGKTFAEVKIVYLERIPILVASVGNQKKLEYFVNVLLQINKISNEEYFSSFFGRLIDAIVYELYLYKEIKEAGCEVLKHLSNLPVLKDNNEKDFKIIEKMYRELSDPKHPVSKAIERMDIVEEIRIIEGKE
ncbi:MAG TPA: TaqI-like C-terminal specificity domain-containing protein [Bacteroidia bacterium]|jgi:adenine-specific DNA-methyltransferase|nr:TaqI-like C-terminal specificity domain-containing protein [Bacteroidia bacterium]